MKEEYDKRIVEKTRPYEGIPELLNSLCSMKVKMSILSNKHNDAVKLVAAKLLCEYYTGAF
jgi:phosphoglycolate phosphatase